VSSAEAAALDARLVVERTSFRLDVELHLEAGAITALIGPNGAGKSTVVNALAGLVELAEGRVALGEHLLDDTAAGVAVPAGARGVAVSFQNALLFDGISVLDNVAYGLRANGVSKPDAHRRAGALLDEVGLGDRGADRPRALSGGLAARVGLARALAVEPRLLLLDEPFAALDAAARTELRHWLARLIGDRGITTLLVTHDPRDAEVLATDAIVIEDGVLTDRRPMADLASSPSKFVEAFLQ